MATTESPFPCSSGVDPDLFFREDRKSIQDAKDLCEQCPVRRRCLELALDGDEPGTWGGTTYQERQKLQTAEDRERNGARRSAWVPAA